MSNSQQGPETDFTAENAKNAEITGEFTTKVYKPVAVHGSQFTVHGFSAFFYAFAILFSNSS
jgi:hypothetical protein